MSPGNADVTTSASVDFSPPGAPDSGELLLSALKKSETGVNNSNARMRIANRSGLKDAFAVRSLVGVDGWSSKGSD